METYRKVNLSELKEIALVWGTRHSSMIKVSFFKGIKALKPYILLFTISPKDHTSFNLQSMFQEDEANELMDSCIGDKKQFKKKWYVFIKLREDYFEINTLSPYVFSWARNTTFILNDDEIDIELSKKNEDEFYSNIVPNYERILYSINSNNDIGNTMEGNIKSDKSLQSSQPLKDVFYKILNDYCPEINIFWECLKRKAKEKSGRIDAVENSVFYDLSIEAYEKHTKQFKCLEKNNIDQKNFYKAVADRRKTVIGNILLNIITDKCPATLSQSSGINTTIEGLFNQFKDINNKAT